MMRKREVGPGVFTAGTAEQSAGQPTRLPAFRTERRVVQGNNPSRRLAKKCATAGSTKPCGGTKGWVTWTLSQSISELRLIQ